MAALWCAMERFRRRVGAEIKGEKTQSSERKKIGETGRPQGLIRVTKHNSYRRKQTGKMDRKLHLTVDICNLITTMILSFYTIMHLHHHLKNSLNNNDSFFFLTTKTSFSGQFK